MIWFLVLMILLPDGSVYTKVNISNDPTYNNEESCKMAGQFIADAKTAELNGNGKVFWSCQNFTADEIKAATGKPGSNS